MKNYRYSGWLKLLAILLALASALGVAASAAGAVLTSVCTYEEVQEEVNYRLLSQLSAYVLSSTGADPEEMEKLDTGNMIYAVTTSAWADSGAVDPEDTEAYVYQSPGYDGSYEEMFLVGTNGHYVGYRYDGNNLLISMSRTAWYDVDDYLGYEYDYILRIVMDVDTGLLYCCCSSGYYLIPYFGLELPAGYSDYELWEEDGEFYYADIDSGERLDLREYASESAAVVLGVEGTQIGFSEELIEALEGSGGGEAAEQASYATQGVGAADYSQYGILAADSDSISQKSVSTTDSYLWENEICYMPEDENYYWVLASVNREYPSADLLSRANEILTRVYALKNWYVALCLLGLAVFAAALAYLLRAAGRRVGTQEIRLRWVDRVPYGVWLSLTGILIASAIGMFAMALSEEWYFMGDQLFFTVEAFFAIAAALLALWLVLGTAARIKSGQFFRYTILYYIWRPLRLMGRWIAAGFGQIRKNLSFFVKLVLVVAAWNLIELVVVIEIWDWWWWEEVLTALIFFKIVEIVLVIATGLQMKRLQDGSAKVASGDTAPIDTKGLFWEFKKHGENINKVGDGISAAVERQMKSERLRTELITNVSHDIKTPLTSIINYVDLMKKLDITDPTALEYMEVLDRQTARLKKLIEDLMDASKASTGNLEVVLEKCDISVLLVQMVGEYEEKAANAQLSFVVSGSESPIDIMADGRYIWRVFDNLLNNICKYGMPGTRVYIDLSVNDGRVDITFKNISRHQLNISSDELMERFVRGDSSRNTEGSGLGLSIARSMAELMGGTLDLFVDGDLFKVTASFPLCGESS